VVPDVCTKGNRRRAGLLFVVDLKSYLDETLSQA